MLTLQPLHLHYTHRAINTKYQKISREETGDYFNEAVIASKLF